MKTPYILVVDDEPDIRELVKEILEDEGYQVAVADSARTARSSKANHKPDLVLLDIWMPGEDGVSLLKDWRNRRELSCPVVMMSGHGTVETAVEATRLGAFDFVEKPLSLAKLLMVVEKALASASNDAQFDSEGAPPIADALIGRSRYVQNLRKQIAKLGETDANLLVTGETATGKSLVMRHIHQSSARARQPFITVHCETLDAEAAVIELFGREQGGVVTPGVFERARGGSVYFDRVEELPPQAQQALLGTLSNKVFTRVGGRTSISFDLRILSSARSDSVASSFDKDLYYKLNVIALNTAPLREHAEDIPALLDHYVDWFVAREDLSYRHFSVAAQNCLRNYNWPGNIRELKNLVQRLLVMGTDVEIERSEVEEALGEQRGDTDNHGLMTIPLDMTLREARSEFERQYLQQQLDACRGSIGQLAKRVGMERTNLYRKLRALGIESGKRK
ncbi:MAG: sigma-54 dependent transcriptional regulator [Pseudomonadota bacterium]